jgi:hypothetical protein
MASDDSEGQVTLTQGLKYGLGLIAVGVGVFLLLALLEGSNRGGRVHWLIALLSRLATARSSPRFHETGAPGRPRACCGLAASAQRDPGEDEVLSG